MRKAKLGSVEFDVVQEETPERSAEVTEHPVEKGTDVADHVRPKPFQMNITGVVAGPDAPKRLSILSKYYNTGQILTYIGRNWINDLVIEEFASSHNVEVRDGFVFDITLKQVRIASLATAVNTAPDPAKEQQTTPPPPGPATGKPTLSTGSKGTHVKQLQQTLKSKGYDPGPIDGIYGPKTKAAVKAFQLASGLTADGTVGNQTWWAVG